MSGATTGAIRRLLGLVRLRQIADQVRHRLSFVPILYAFGAFVVVQLLLLLDRSLNHRQIPAWLATTVDSARSVFAAIAGGLITSITLLLSMMLVAVQLASSQFSPRTLRDWLGNRTLQHALGIVLGTTVFCLLALRSTRDLAGDSEPIIPHITVLVAVVLGVVSLVAVVRAVDHMTHSVRVGAVTGRVAADTINVVKRTEVIPRGQSPESVPAAQPSVEDELSDIPADAEAVELSGSGWIQQIDDDSIIDALPDGATAFVPVSVGGFVPAGSPLIWVSAPEPIDDACRAGLRNSFAVGDSRTLQQDVEFGLVQLTDIAVRALSPGINDPTTAADVIVHIADVLLEIWQRPAAAFRREHEGRTIVMMRPTHEAYLARSVGPIVRYGATDPEVMSSIIRTLGLLRSEVIRRDLPGPLAPIDETILEAATGANRETWSAGDIRRFDELITSTRPRSTNVNDRA